MLLCYEPYVSVSTLPLTLVFLAPQVLPCFGVLLLRHQATWDSSLQQQMHGLLTFSLDSRPKVVNSLGLLLKHLHEAE